MKKKNVTLLTMAALCFALAGCSNGNSNAGVTSGEETELVESNTEANTEETTEETTEEGDSEETNNEEIVDGESEETEPSGDIQEEKLLEGIYAQITESVELDAPIIAPDTYITNSYGIDVSLLEEYVFSMSEASTSAECIIMIKVGDEVTTDEICEKLEQWKEYREQELEDYLPEQYNLVNESEINCEGEYVWLVISANSQSILDIISDNL